MCLNSVRNLSEIEYSNAELLMILPRFRRAILAVGHFKDWRSSLASINKVNLYVWPG